MIIGGMLGGAVLSTAMSPRTQSGDSGVSKDQATLNANAQIAESQRRRRAARGLLSLGVSDQTTLGEGQGTKSPWLSLLGLGAGAGAGSGGGGGGGYNPASAGAGVPGAYYGGSGTSQRAVTPLSSARSVNA